MAYVVALGPFKSYYPHNGRIVFTSASELHPRDYVALDASRIIRVYEKDGVYYVVYETENVDYYKPFLTVIPNDAVDLEKLVYKKRIVKCIDDICPEPCLEDPDYDPACYDHIEVKYEDVKVWRKPNREPVAVMEVQPSVEDLLAWKSVTRRNVEPVVKKLADWDATGWTTMAGNSNWLETRPMKWQGTELKGRIIAEAELEEPFVHMQLVEGGYLVTSDWDYCCDYKPVDGFIVMLAYRDKEMEVVKAVYKMFRDEDDAREFYDRLAKLLEPYKRKTREKPRMERREPSKEELIQELLSKLPEWADGAYIKYVAWYGAEEGEEDADVYPVKASKFGNGWYYAKNWRKIAMGYKYLAIGRDVVVTRDGKIVKVKERNGRSRYITLVPQNDG